MPLTLYNTLTRKKEAFAPLDPGKVRMYCCGVTVYDYCHLGHARSYIVWDVVRRYLQWSGYEVTFVQNFTDIDDKIIKRAQEEDIPWQEVTAKYIEAYQEDMAKLNIQPADAYPKATEVIPQIIDFIQSLIDRDYAYLAQGDVYYAVERFPSYGKLSGRRLEDMEAGASGRLEEEAEAKKRHPMDFALWKAAKPGEPQWESPWGPGRPGWHIECSAMVKQILGDRIDIHTGGEDLVFPHHENEIAQSEAALAKPLSTYWLHNGFVKIRGDKMSKSLKNFTTIRALLDVYDPMVVRLFVLQAYYRKPIDFTEDAMAAATNGWETLKEGLSFGDKWAEKLEWPERKDPTFGEPDHMRAPADSPAIQAFRSAMDDDFNTAGALAVLFDLAKDLRKEQNLLVHEGKTSADSESLKRQWYTLVSLAQVLGLRQQQGLTSESAGAQAGAADPTLVSGLSETEIEALIQQRSEARKAKNWSESDRIRDELKAQGIELIDSKEGTRWHRV